MKTSRSVITRVRAPLLVLYDIGAINIQEGLVHFRRNVTLKTSEKNAEKERFFSMLKAFPIFYSTLIAQRNIVPRLNFIYD